MITVKLLVEALADADWLSSKGDNGEFVVVADCDGSNVFDFNDLECLCDEINKRIVVTK